MKGLINIVPMDDLTKRWLIDCIDTAPNQDSLNGIITTLEFFYSIDKDFDTFSYFIERVNQKQKLLN
jgi:hypothetical protein